MPRTGALEQFDRLDLNERSQCRLAAYALRDFYGATLSEIGQKYLGFPPEFRKQQPKKQWNKVLTRLESLDDHDEVPEELRHLPFQVHEISNEVDHDYDENPHRGRLIEARELAEDWQTWLHERAERYQQAESELTAKESMIRIARESLQSTRRPEDDIYLDHLWEDQEELNERADATLERLEAIEADKTGVTVELVHLLLNSKELEREAEELLNEQDEVAEDMHIQMRVDEHLERSRRL